MAKNYCSALSEIDAKSKIICDCSDYLWDNPELAFTEFKSARYICDLLKSEGFEVEENLTGIPTAFSGRYGKGHPVIGLLGEYDALSGLSQEAEGLTNVPLNGVACGQGCGHNLLGAGTVGAAIGIKKYLEESGVSGTVIFYGTPAEEGGSGKAFMARDGAFDELDVALCWHPDSKNAVRTASSLSNYQILYKFDGQSSHAGAAPDKGRSALDAVELMNVGVQFLREHMSDDCRVHYAITDAGGISPNVVQPHAEVLYLIRAVNNVEVKALYERVNKIAAGAAMMTETKESHVFIKACSNVINNGVLQKVMQGCMEEINPPVPDEKELKFARDMAAVGIGTKDAAIIEKPYKYEVQPFTPATGVGHGSSDVGDTSWVCPTVWFSGCTEVTGTPGHSWQETSQGKGTYAKKGMLYAAKILAATAIEVIDNPALVEEAKKEHKATVGAGYEAPIPKDVKPKALTSL